MELELNTINYELIKHGYSLHLQIEYGRYIIFILKNKKMMCGISTNDKMLVRKFLVNKLKKLLKNT